MEVFEVLVSAKELISDKSRWTQGSMAKSKKGRYCEYDYKEAGSWCAMGAVYKEAGKDKVLRDDAIAFLWTSAASNMSQSIVFVNDNGSHEEVMEMFDRAIRLAKDD